MAIAVQTEVKEGNNVFIVAKRQKMVDKRYCPECGEIVRSSDAIFICSCGTNFKHSFCEPEPDIIESFFYQNQEKTKICPKCGEMAYDIGKGTFCAECGEVVGIVANDDSVMIGATRKISPNLFSTGDRC